MSNSNSMSYGSRSEGKISSSERNSIASSRFEADEDVVKDGSKTSRNGSGQLGKIVDRKSEKLSRELSLNQIKDVNSSGDSEGQEDSTSKMKSTSNIIHKSAFNAPPPGEETAESIQLRKKLLMIPKDAAAWLDYMTQMARKKVHIDYLSDKELKKVITRARKNIGVKKVLPYSDPELPEAYYWSEKEVGLWVAKSGYPKMQEAFENNFINGRRLIKVDASALNRMGMRDLAEMKDLAGKIRELLGTHTPNILRGLMRIVPYEQFLKERSYSGFNYDQMTFKGYCTKAGFNYCLWKTNKNALIPCTCSVEVKAAKDVTLTVPERDDSDEENSLKNAPTVEFLVRNAILRNKTVQNIIEQILYSVFAPREKVRSPHKSVTEILQENLQQSFQISGIEENDERLEFATSVADALLQEMMRTADILDDIQRLKAYIKEEVTQERLAELRAAAAQFMEEVLPIAVSTILGEVEMEQFFLEDAEVEAYIDEVIAEAEQKVEDIISRNLLFINSIIKNAVEKVKHMGMHYLIFENLEFDPSAYGAEDRKGRICDEYDDVFPRGPKPPPSYENISLSNFRIPRH